METHTVIVAGAAVVLTLIIFAGLHEKHYRDRRGEISAARYEGLERRLTTLENLYMEDRLA
jgi:hypothetical protein